MAVVVSQSIQSYAILEEHTEFGCLKRPLTGKKKFSHFKGPIDIALVIQRPQFPEPRPSSVLFLPRPSSLLPWPSTSPTLPLSSSHLHPPGSPFFLNPSSSILPSSYHPHHLSILLHPFSCLPTPSPYSYSSSRFKKLISVNEMC